MISTNEDRERRLALLQVVSRLASGLAALRYLIDHDPNQAADVAAILEGYACDMLEEEAQIE